MVHLVSQDLSVAGRRAGLAGERSGLFMEQIRIVKEMRERDRLENGRPIHLCRPRFMVWENVPGAFSSNGGKDFQAVLEEIVGIVEANVPDLHETVTGGWTKSRCLYDEMGAWSVAWRVHDAQFWGVPQRRKRIALVADFGGLAAPEILFERKGLHWYPEPSGETGQGTAKGTESGTDRTICLQGNGIDRADTAGCNGAGWRRGGVTPLTQLTDQPLSVSKNEPVNQGGAKESLFSVNTQEPCQPSTTRAYSIQGNTIDRDTKQNGAGISADVAHTLDGADRHGVMCAGFSFGQSDKARGIGWQEETSPTIRGGEGGNQKPVVMAVDCRNGTENECINGTLQAKEQGSSLNLNNVVRIAKP